MRSGPEPQPTPDVAVRFIRAAWGGDPLPGDLLLWTMGGKSGKREPKKVSYWLKNSQGIANIVNGYAQHRNIYFGVGLPGQNTPRTNHNRCESSAIAGLCGLYLDIDFADPDAPAAHRKSNLPPNCEAALGLIHAMPVPPTIIVHSGHGLQPYWIFSNPWIFSDAKERERAGQLSYSWNAHLIGLASEHGWQADSVFDLARVLRLPGTLNLKPNCPPMAVRVLTWDGPRYTAEELAGLVALLPSPSTVTTRGNHRQNGKQELDGVCLSESAEPPAEKFEQPYRRSEKFADSWERRRMDLADQSGSGYDFSLAILAARFDWSDAEIVALLIAHHRKHGADLKLNRPQYYAHTINKARRACEERSHSNNSGVNSNPPTAEANLEEIDAES